MLLRRPRKGYFSFITFQKETYERASTATSFSAARTERADKERKPRSGLASADLLLFIEAVNPGGGFGGVPFRSFPEELLR